MWKLSDVERNVFDKLIEDVSIENHLTKQQILRERIKYPDGKDGLTIESILKNNRISYMEVDGIYRCLPPAVKFYEFIDLLTPFVQEQETSTEEAARKAEYRIRIKRLKEAQDNREYLEMTKSIDPCHLKNKNLMNNFGQEIRAVNRQLIAIVNTLITVGGAFTFGFYGIHMAYPHLGLEIPTRMLMGLICGTIVFFADIYFIIRNME